MKSTFGFAFALSALVACPALAHAAAPLPVIVHGDALPRAALHDALVKELGREVVLADADSSAEHLTITWRSKAHELAVSYDAGTRTVARVVAAPDAAARVIEDASLLAANLLRQDVPAAEPVAPVTPAAPLAPVVPIPPVTPTAPVPPAPTANAPAVDSVPAVASFVYPLATNLQRPWVRTAFEFNLLQGRVGALDGLELGTLGMVLGSRAHPGATGDVHGAQISALASVASGHVSGLQLGFASTIAGGGVDGLQLSGVNVAAGPVRGVQLGAVNIATGKVQGAQIGFVNYAKDVDGVPIGIVSVTESGGIHPVAWSSSSTFGNFGVKFATKYTYTMPYLSMHHAYDRLEVGGGGAVGARIPLGRYLRIELDLAFTYLRAVQDTPSIEMPGRAYGEQLFQPRFRGAFHVAPAKHFSVFVGAGVVPEVRLVDVSRSAELRIRPEIFGGIQL